MRCPSCQLEVSETAKFCEQCGAPQKRRCPDCGHTAKATAKFCGDCGTRLQAPASVTATTPAPPEPARSPSSEAERRQLTVMFCDLVGSTSLAGELDPEDLREVVRSYQRCCGEVIRRFDGHIAQYLGDGILVYFGYPRAYEDAPHRAVRSGLGILGELKRLNRGLERDKGIRVAVRIGIHTGLVVVGSVGGDEHTEKLALGATPNVAARLQDLAEPGAVVISADTAELVRGFFDLRDRGRQTLKGVSGSVQIFEVSADRNVANRLDATTSQLTTLVGRRQEMEVLEESCKRAREGSGQVVMVTGEAGIGKSRLVRALEQRAAAQGFSCLELHCSPYHRHSALFSIIDFLNRELQLAEEDAEGKQRKVKEMLTAYEFELAEAVPLFLSLLSVPMTKGSYPELALSPQQQNQKTQDALIQLLLRQADQQPLLVVWEDLHWAAPSTLDLLGRLIEEARGNSILVVLTFRLELKPGWPASDHLEQIMLERLHRHQTEGIVSTVTGGKPLPTEVLDQLVTKTDGVPLFVEELTKMVLESGLLEETEDRFELNGPLPPLAIPTTLQDSLMARLDRLSRVKEVAQLGATLGREFSYDLLKAVSSLDDEALQSGLARLVDAELLYREGVPPKARFFFKHALIRDTAYQSLLKSSRYLYHQKIAQVLVSRFPETASIQPELVAHHYTEAGALREAVRYWKQAGEKAAKRSANIEATNHLSRGLEILRSLPKTKDRMLQEIELHAALGTPLLATRGHGTPEVEKNYSRAWELCQSLGEDPRLFGLSYGFYLYFMARANLSKGRDLSEQLLRLAESRDDQALGLPAHQALGTAEFYLGGQVAARRHFERGIELDLVEYQDVHARYYGIDSGLVNCMVYNAWSLWFLGWPEQSLTLSQRAIEEARDLDRSFCVTRALVWKGWLHLFRGEPERVIELADRGLRMAVDEGFPLWKAVATLLRGGALARDPENAEAALADLEFGLEALHSTGVELGTPYFLSLFAEVYALLGRIDDSFAALDEAMERAKRTGERYWEAEFHRQRGELLARQSAENHDLARGCFELALDVAREQSARTLEVRAAVSLARLRLGTDEAGEARQLVSQLLDSFTEGFDSPDLRNARSLLEDSA